MATSHEIIQGDCLESLRAMDAGSVACCVTSPPYYGLRDYGHAGQMGLEPSPREYVAKMVEVFREVRRVLADDGTLWLNLGDSYNSGETGRKDNGRLEADQVRWSQPMERQASRAERRTRSTTGLPAKNLLGIPWRVAFALQDDGWYLRQDIIWAKPNPMPESVRDRCTKAHEYVFLLSKSPRYRFDADAIREPHAEPHRGKGDPAKASRSSEKGRRSSGIGGTTRVRSGCLNSMDSPGSERVYNPLGRNKRSVWTVTPKPFKGAHFAVMPEALVEPCVLAGCPAGGVVLDPFAGSGTVGVVAKRLGRSFVGCELNPEYARIARQRIAAATPEAA